jgi:SAM-dependent methyltransferase
VSVIDRIRAQPDLRTLLKKTSHHFLYYLKFPKRMRSVTRISMERELEKLIPLLTPGSVLDVGSEDAPYRRLMPATRFVTLDVTHEYGADIVSDIHRLGIASASFDSVIATEVLEHCRDPRQAIIEVRRILKSGGTCILTTRFIQAYHPTPHDFYRFTWDSLADLFATFSEVRIIHHGNTIQSIWTLLTAGALRPYLNVLNPIVARIRSEQTVNPCGFLIFARK